MVFTTDEFFEVAIESWPDLVFLLKKLVDHTP